MKLTLEEMLLLKNLLVEIRECFPSPSSGTEFVKLAISVNDQIRLREISHKLSDEIRETMRANQPAKELKHG